MTRTTALRMTANKARFSSSSSSSSSSFAGNARRTMTTTTSRNERRRFALFSPPSASSASSSLERENGDGRQNDGTRRALVTGGATLLASTAFFHATASSAEAKLPEFQYDEEKLIEAPSGLKYADVVVGAGASPTKGQTIQAHYTGRLTNGRTFDSSYERGSPLKFKVGVHQVIQGWDDGILGAEGVEGMKVGGKRVLIIPPELGYGARGAGGVIPGNATLKFDVELVAVL
jgi:FKBP-type peptidyl-prolyl cis-trans isomerase